VIEGSEGLYPKNIFGDWNPEKNEKSISSGNGVR